MKFRLSDLAVHFIEAGDGDNRQVLIHRGPESLDRVGNAHRSISVSIRKFPCRGYVYTLGLRRGGNAEHRYLPFRRYRSAKNLGQGGNTHVGGPLPDQHVLACNLLSRSEEHTSELQS